MPGSWFAGDWLLPLPNRCADGFEVLGGESGYFAARFTETSRVADGVGGDGAVAYGEREHPAEGDPRGLLSQPMRARREITRRLIFMGE